MGQRWKGRSTYDIRQRAYYTEIGKHNLATTGNVLSHNLNSGFDIKQAAQYFHR